MWWYGRTDVQVKLLLPIIITTVVSKWIGDSFNHGLYHTALGEGMRACINVFAGCFCRVSPITVEFLSPNFSEWNFSVLQLTNNSAVYVCTCCLHHPHHHHHHHHHRRRRRRAAALKNIPFLDGEERRKHRGKTACDVMSTSVVKFARQEPIGQILETLRGAHAHAFQ